MALACAWSGALRGRNIEFRYASRKRNLHSVFELAQGKGRMRQWPILLEVLWPVCEASGFFFFFFLFYRRMLISSALLYD